MNERIVELAELAGFEKDKYDLFWDANANSEGVDLEKFAKLIINECIGFIAVRKRIAINEGMREELAGLLTVQGDIERCFEDEYTE